MRKNNKFNNPAARAFNDDLSKIDAMSQDRIFGLLDGDMKKILDQFTAFRHHDRGASFPVYVANGFANLSTTLYFYKFIKKHCWYTKKGKWRTDLDKDELESLRMILADVYRKSSSNFYAKELNEYSDRNRMVAKAFVRLTPKLYRLTKRFKGLSKSQRRDLCIQIYGDPVYNMVRIHKIVNSSTVRTDKKKLKILRKLYGKKRFVTAAGAAMTVESNGSDCLATIFDHIMGLKKRKRAPYIRAYAEAYKKQQTRYFRIDAEFVEKNKDIIDELYKKVDIGYKKAFKVETAVGKDDKRGKDHDFRPERFRPDKDRKTDKK